LVNPVEIDANSGVSGSYDLTLTGQIDNQGGSHTLTVNNTGLTTFSGLAFNLNDGTAPVSLTLNVAGSSGGLTIASPIQNGSAGGTGSLIKSGAGTLTLSAANTYSGGTIINAGTVVVRNTSGSGTGSGSVLVNSGGTLSGNGIISGALTLNTGGRISPGV
jgi:autotransporter-associated beta strand protein